jgi:signal transduction histidine kinase/DNA-binding response OmpR family regulator
MQYRWLYLTFFNAFILTCAATHFLSVVTIWIPLYWAEAYASALAAVVATATVFAIWWVIPKALKLPSPAELIIERDKAEAANIAKSVFLANMSHELRTPLNAILGFSSLMFKDTQLLQDQREKLEIINRSGSHLLSLIDDILEIAKIESGRMHLDTAPFDLGIMTRDAIDLLELRAKEKGLQLLLDQASEFPRYINGDEARMRQILVNLVGNAIKFTKQGGVTIRLGTKNNTTPNLILEVEDSGIGISKEDQKLLFQPFVQLNTQAGDTKGTGLGLAITRQFVQMMGGSISLESTVGKGSLFRVELPLIEATGVEVVKQASVERGEIIGLAPGQPTYRILIVEDQLENQLLLVKLMERIGLDVKVAENGERGVELFKSWHPHLIWMDRRMAIMDGIEATKAIRALPYGNNVKIVAVTASVFTEQRQELIKIGMDGFVRKPYRFNEIYDSLASQLGIKYIHSETFDEKTVDLTLTHNMLSILDSELRKELYEALEALDAERIEDAILQVTNVTVQKTLLQYASNFDYMPILNALQEH